MYRSLLLAVAVLSASTALAQEDELSPSLNGVGRMSLQTGWRLTSNNTLYDGYYKARPGLARGPGSPGGPLAIGSFAYGLSESMELGIDLFATGERLRLADQPELTTLTYGALLGMRFQGVVPGLGQGLVPFAGILTGPTLAYSRFESGEFTEVVTQTWAGTVGATLRLSPRWGLTAEYRLTFVRGAVPERGGQKFGSFNAGGNWLSLGMTYSWPPKPSRPIGGGLGF